MFTEVTVLPNSYNKAQVFLCGYIYCRMRVFFPDLP